MSEPAGVGDKVKWKDREGIVFRDPGYVGADDRWWLGVQFTTGEVFTINREELEVIE